MLLLLYIVDVNVNIFEKMFNINVICIKSVVKSIIVYVVTYDML